MTAVASAVDEPDLGPLRPPGDTTGLFGVLRRRYLLKLLVQKELKVRYQGSLLGLAWSYVKPLVRFSMYFFVIGVLLGLRDSIPLFALHIFSAMIMVTFFTETLNAGTKSVLKNKSLVRKMNVPREMFPVASVLVTTYHAGPQYVILIVACLFLGWSPDPTAFVAAVLGIAIMFTISLAVALAFSALNVSFRDFGNFVETIGMMVLWSAPQLYPWEFVADTLGPVGEQIYLANPVAIVGAAEPARVLDAHRAQRRDDRHARRPAAARRHHAGLLPGARRCRAAGVLEARDTASPRRCEPMTESVVVDHVSKNFTLQNARTLKQRIVRRSRAERTNPTFLALDDVSFTVEQGEAIGLMGLNGSGKSTLLKLISGVLRPDNGAVLTRGTIAGLIEVSAGFHPELSGRENIYLNAAILGMGEAEVNRKFDEIVDFAEIGKFLDSPVGRYSSGMFARLGFSVAVMADSDIFIIDEVLAVGDPPFKKKCIKRIREVRDEGRTIVFVSHNTTQVRRLCTRAIVLEEGRLGFDGAVGDAVHYLKYDEDPGGDEDGDGGEL